MTTRISLLAVSALAAAISGFVGVGCRYCEWSDVPNPGVPIDLGVDVDLHGVIGLLGSDGDRRYAYLAVGEAGTIVRWGSENQQLFVEVSQIGDADLRAAWFEYDYNYNPSTTWWVVGDAGAIITSDNLGETWNPIELGLEADLRAIVGFEGRPVIVGEEVVLVRLADGTWTQPPTPAGGWGSLRDIATDGDRLYAVGLAGKVWSTEDPSGVWIAEPIGVSVDFFGVAMNAYHDEISSTRVTAVGKAGTVFDLGPAGWRRRDVGLSVDLIDIHGPCVLAADGEVYVAGSGGSLEAFDHVPGAAGIDCDHAAVTVGIGGLATTSPPDDC